MRNRIRKEAEVKVSVRQKFAEGDHERFGGADWKGPVCQAEGFEPQSVGNGKPGRPLRSGCLQASSADKVLRTKESYPKSLLFISIKGVLFHLLTVKLAESSCSGFYEADPNDEKKIL